MGLGVPGAEPKADACAGNGLTSACPRPWQRPGTGLGPPQRGGAPAFIAASPWSPRLPPASGSPQRRNQSGILSRLEISAAQAARSKQRIGTRDCMSREGDKHLLFCGNEKDGARKALAPGDLSSPVLAEEGSPKYREAVRPASRTGRWSCLTSRRSQLGALPAQRSGSRAPMPRTTVP